MLPISRNLQAFLDTISHAEGTFGIGDNGYNVLVGSTAKHPLLFTSYADHPRIYNAKYNSTAAGRYQLLERYFDAYKKQLGLLDFSPASQDAIAIRQIRECEALPFIEAGNIGTAGSLVAHIWASFPGAGYGQPELKMTAIANYFRQAGGTSEAA